MNIDASMVKELRQISGGGVLDCKKALEEAEGDFEKAVEILRVHGAKGVTKRAERTASNGLVTSYLEGSQHGVLLELNCETDFVARTAEFQTFCRQVAMQIAAFEPVAVSREDIPPETVEGEKEIYRAQLRETGKPEAIIEKIVEGRLEKYFEEACLLDQEWIHDASAGKVADVRKALVAKIGENVVIRRFARFQIGS